MDNKVLPLKFKSGASEQDIVSFEATHRLKKLRQAITGFIDYEIPPLHDITSVHDRLQKSALVETLQYNYMGHLLSTPNDPLFPDQWHLNKIKADAAWDITTGSSSIVVATLDTGIEWEHPDLDGVIIPQSGRRCLANTVQPLHRQWHGQ